MSAHSSASLWLIDAVLRGHRRGRGCRPSTVWIGEITSKRPAACVKKILHSGSAQMNPGGAWNCFQRHSHRYIMTLQSFSVEATNDISKCLCSITPAVPWGCDLAVYVALHLWMEWPSQVCCQWEITLVTVAALKILTTRTKTEITVIPGLITETDPKSSRLIQICTYND